MRSLHARYKKYATGGATSAAMDLFDSAMPAVADAVVPGAGQIASTVGRIGSGIFDAFDRPDKYGMQSKSTVLGKAMLTGGTPGMLAAAFGYKGMKRQADAMRADEEFQERQTSAAEGRARIAADPSSVYGNQQTSYYENGGSLRKHYAKGGSLKPVSSTAVEVNGPSHEGGGVKIPGAEVEGGETINSGYVFSERLGFAQIHKPIARALGKIEQKTMSPERMNSIKLLKGIEQNLKNEQESLREYLGYK